VIRFLPLLALVVIFAGCAEDTKHRILISTSSQRMIVLRDAKSELMCCSQKAMDFEAT